MIDNDHGIVASKAITRKATTTKSADNASFAKSSADPSPSSSRRLA